LKTITIDVVISNASSSSSDQSSSAVRVWTIATFTIIAGIFVVAQFFVLNMIKEKNDEGKFYD
jgi:hypothetical protein